MHWQCWVWHCAGLITFIKSKSVFCSQCCFSSKSSKCDHLHWHDCNLNARNCTLSINYLSRLVFFTGSWTGTYVTILHMGNQLTGYCQWSILQISPASRNLAPVWACVQTLAPSYISVHNCEHRINLLSHGVVRRGHGGTGHWGWRVEV